MENFKRMLALLSFMGAIAVITPAFADETQQAEKRPAKDIVLKGDAKCTSCHDEADAPELLAIGKTRHGVTADGRTPTCTDCHGESDSHTNYKGSAKPPKPDRSFGKNTATPAAERNAACLNCHKGGSRMQWAGSQHEDIACNSCHKVHHQHDTVSERTTQTEICFSCHKEQRAQSNRMSHHPIQEGKVVCSNCHNPHGSSGPALLHKNTVGETCFTCHAEKRGPFLWEHPPVTDNCSNCHTSHGSNNAALLKNRQPFLCASCHIAGGHSTTGIRSGNDLGRAVTPGGAVVGAFPNAATGGGALPGTTSAASQMVGKSCLNCHIQIHGSNHPSGARFAR